MRYRITDQYLYLTLTPGESRVMEACFAAVQQLSLLAPSARKKASQIVGLCQRFRTCYDGAQKGNDMSGEAA